MPATGGYQVGYLHPGEVAHSFHQSLLRLLEHERNGPRRVSGVIAEQCGSARITDGRNAVVRKFLAGDAEWLLWVDADMGFDPDAVDMLWAVADADERPIVGGLCFSSRRSTSVGAEANHHTVVPTIYRWVETDLQAGFAPVLDYPRDSIVKCDATGSAFVLVHRSVFTTMAERFPPPRAWYDETIYKGDVFGEDLTFCKRATELGMPVHVVTGARISHRKVTFLHEDTVDLSRPTYVVVPVKDRYDLTGPLLHDLERQGQAEAVIVCDNGSSPGNREQLNRHDCIVLDMPGANIHEMWNAGLELASALAAGRQHQVAILNNDVKLGPNFLEGLKRALRADPRLSVVSPNYDGRDLTQTVLTRDICADRYDGSGGVAGFAFMLLGESGYRFPEQLQWWYGDSDLMAHVAQAGSYGAVVGHVLCEHVDGGGQTGDWDAMADVLEADRRAFRDMWVRPPDLRFVGVSTGRAGSAWIANVMRAAGIHADHELRYNAENFVAGEPAEAGTGALGEWSAQALPFLDGYDGLVWHQVRHPLKVIGSYLGFGLFHDPASLGAGGRFMAEQFDIDTDDPLRSAVRFYLECNRRCGVVASERWRVEDVDASLIVRLGKEVGVDVTLEQAEAALLQHPTTTNTKGTAVPVTWDDLKDVPEVEQLKAMAAEYGYETE